MLEWFEMNREKLQARGFVIIEVRGNPEAYWIEPSAFVSFKTPFYMGDFETTIDGRYRYFLLPNGEDVSDGISNFYWFIGLDSAAIEYRRKYTYSGNEEDVNWEPQIEIHYVSDYDNILEPLITKATQPFQQGESNANI